MNKLPDFNRIGAVVSAWQRRVLTDDEAHERILDLLRPKALIPKAEYFPDPEVLSANRQLMGTLERVESKLNLMIRQHDLLLPDEIDPDILSADVRKLADENRKIEAVSLHRSRTGAGFAETVTLVNRYLQQRKSWNGSEPPSSPDVR